MLCAGWQMGTLANTISSSLANCAIATLLLLSSPRHLNLPFICPKMIIATIVTWCRCQIMSSHFPRKSAQQAGHQWSTKYYCDVAKGVVVMCHVSSRHSPRVHSATCDAAVCHVAGVRDVRPLLQVLRGADGVPAVLQGPGQGQPGLQGVLGGEWR